MLHIILVILKIVGILLAAILLLLLLVLLLLLFAPLRYRVWARWGPGKPGVRVSVSWLGGLLQMKGAFDRGKGFRARVKAVWITLLRIPGKTAGENSGRPRAKEAVRQKKTEKAVAKTGQGDPGPAAGGREEADKPQPPQTETDAGNPEKRPNTGQPDALKAAQTEEVLPKEPPVEEEQFAAGKEREEAGHAGRRGLAVFRSRLRGFAGKLRKTAETLRGIPKRIRALAGRIRQTADRIMALKEKLSGYLDFLCWEPVQNTIREVKKQLLYLWKHYRPRKAEGRIVLGFEDPSLTGQAAGLLYLLTANPGNTVEIAPVFDAENPVLEGEFSIQGRIRLCHLARAGLKLALSRDLRASLNRLKTLR